MLAKFEIILDKEEILKIHCIGKLKKKTLKMKKKDF